jgi:hypothetical protein
MATIEMKHFEVAEPRRVGGFERRVQLILQKRKDGDECGIHIAKKHAGFRHCIIETDANSRLSEAFLKNSSRCLDFDARRRCVEHGIKIELPTIQCALDDFEPIPGENLVSNLGAPSSSNSEGVTVYPITIYHRPRFERDRIAAALPAAANVSRCGGRAALSKSHLNAARSSAVPFA